MSRYAPLWCASSCRHGSGPRERIASPHQQTRRGQPGTAWPCARDPGTRDDARCHLLDARDFGLFLGGFLLRLRRSGSSPVGDRFVGRRDGSSGHRHGQDQQSGEHDVFPSPIAVLGSDVVGAGAEDPEPSGDQRQQHHLQGVDDQGECDEVGHAGKGPDQR